MRSRPLSGCGANADSLVKKQIAQMNEMADAIENDASESEIEAIDKRMKATAKELDELDLSKEKKDELKERYSEELTKAQTRLAKVIVGKMAEEMPKAVPGMRPGEGLPGPSEPDGL